MHMFFLILLGLVCATSAQAESGYPSGYGPHPVLPEPDESLLPTAHIASAVGWPPNGKPVPADGLSVTAFADGLDHPRWLYVLPNGDVLVAETNAPPKPAERGVKVFFMNLFMKDAGAATKSANRITLLRDTDGDGRADIRQAFLTGLNSPFGMALVGEMLYVANTDSIVKFPYHTGDVQITALPVKVADLPGGPRNHHWTKNIIASPDGRFLYASAGSNSNVAENGMDEEVNRAAILQVNLADGSSRVFASGLRNPNGMVWQPETGALWTVVNERDELGDDLVPDYLTSVQDGGFYGWPYSYFGPHVDKRVKPARPDMVASALEPDYALGAHTASLGLAYSGSNALTGQFHGGAFIGQHGSWNSSRHVGYKVIFVPFAGGQPSGPPVDVLTGFLNENGEAQGRPVGVAFDKEGTLLVADDVGNVIWRVRAAAAP